MREILQCDTHSNRCIGKILTDSHSEVEWQLAMGIEKCFHFSSHILSHYAETESVVRIEIIHTHINSKGCGFEFSIIIEQHLRLHSSRPMIREEIGITCLNAYVVYFEIP